MLEVLQQTDQQLMLALNGLHNPFWDQVMWLYSAKLTWVPMYAAILYVIVRNFNLRLTFFTLIAITLTITFADQVCATFIRPFVERMRPSNLNNPLSEFIHIVNEKRGGRYGFPSCHASNSFGLAFFIMLLFKNRVLTLFIMLWAAINCYSRIYLGVHYPGDLIAGAVVGLVGAVLVYSLYARTLRFQKFASLVGVTETDNPVTHTTNLKYTTTIIYIGLITMLVFVVYAFF